MKSLYFQTVGIECKFYENQQLEYRLYSWGQSVFEKLFLHNCARTILQNSFCPNSIVTLVTAPFIDSHTSCSRITFVCDTTFQSVTMIIAR